MKNKSSIHTEVPRLGEKSRLLKSIVVSTILAASVGGCAVGPDFVRPKAPIEAGYTQEKLQPETTSTEAVGGVKQHFVEAKDIPGQWWTLFHSDSLNILINEALKANPDVASAQAALRQAQENVYAAGGSLYPNISGGVSGSRGTASAQNVPYTTNSPLNVTTASLSISYAPDVFGGVRRQIESSKAQAEYERFQLEATYLTLTSNLVNSAVSLASLREQITATETIINSFTDQLEMIRQQYELGAVTKADVLAQEASLEQTRAKLPPLQKQLAQARNQLMSYLGRFPNQDKGESFELASISLPEELPVSLPSKLVEQRPDVRAAEALLHEASANIGVATANQLPQFNITGQLSSSAAALSGLFSPGSGLWNLAGSVTQSIFDGGTLKHRKLAAKAAYDQAAAQYRKTVLSAFQDVANALRAVQADADALKAYDIAERSALDSLNITKERYEFGAINQIALLNAEQTYQNAVTNRVGAQAARYSDTVALFQALGGGWWNRSDIAPEREQPRPLNTVASAGNPSIELNK